MRRLVSVLALIPALAMAGCAPVTTSGDPAPPVPSTVSTETTVTDWSTTAPSPEGSTTTSALVDPAEDFLGSLVAAPDVTAVVAAGFRTWHRQDGVWLAGPLVSFPDGPFDVPPLAVSTPAGTVFESSGNLWIAGEMVVPDAGEVTDVAMAGGTPVAITVDGERVSAVDMSTGRSTELYESTGEVRSASYGSGRLVLVRGTEGEAIEVGPTGDTSVLDLLTDGAPRSLVVTPDGAFLVFSTDADDTSVYTLAVGSQGPAAAFPLPVAGPITRLDTDGAWVSGMVGEQSFLLDLGSGAAFTGPAGVRFTFDRTDRTYLGPGVDRILDGRFFGWIRQADAGSIVFDEAEFLTGEAAAAAAEAAGEESPPPNDFYIRNSKPDTVRIPIGARPDIRIQGNVLQAGIGLESVTLEQWLALLGGDTGVVDFEWYGGGTLPYWITVKDGQVSSIEEVYLP